MKFKSVYLIPCLLSLNALIKIVYPVLQHLVSVGVGHAAKTTCSGVFLSNRSIESIKAHELEGISSWIVKPVVNLTEKSVTATFLGISPKLSDVLNLRVGKAQYLGSSFGCSLTMSTFNKKLDEDEYYNSLTKRKLVVDNNEINSNLDDSDACSMASSTSDTECKNVDVSGQIASSLSSDIIDMECLKNVINYEFTEEAFKANQTRAIVVSYDNEIIGEKYQEIIGIQHDTKLLGWSMTKSLFSAIIGVAIEQNILTLDSPIQLRHLKPEKKKELIENNNGKEYTFRQLLQMYDILGFVEDYNIMQDVVFMLYGTYETVKFATSRPTYADSTRQPYMGWYYSSAVSNLISDELRYLFPSDEDYWQFPHKHLFSKINASSFAIELDAKGTFVASSFGYATARDWTKMGELFMNKGRYKNSQIISEEYVNFVTSAHSQSGGYYGGHFWLNPARSLEKNEVDLLHENHPIRKRSWLKDVVPADMFYMSGHDGQNVFIIPSKRLVITRLGFTHDSDTYTRTLVSSLMSCVKH